ncbi:MAG: HAMP domain-containing sensor histidine kinase, partial [Marinoscillum sp.]
LDAMLRDQRLHLSQPINLLEGYVGLPITFSVVKDGKVLGYIAAIIDFNALVTSLYEVNDGEEFVYRFSVGDELDFDRARVHDGARVYHDQVDSTYYQYYNLEKGDFLYSRLNLYGLEFQIGSAPVGTLYAGSANEFLSILLYGWYLLLITFFGFSLYRLMKFRKLNIRLQDSNRTIQQQTNQLETQNAELKQVVHTKDKLFSIIGHDLKSPLNSLITIVNLAESDRISADETRNFVHDVGRAARHNLNLLDNLLRWSMQNSGADRVRKMDFRLFDMVQDTSDQLEMVAKTKQINIVNEVEKNLMLQADYEMISTVLRNLISNAIKFSYPEDSILVDAKIEKDTVILSVTDTGVGMTQDELNALFHTGSDVVRRGTNDEPGTGLGLVVVRDFIEKHDGELIIHSKEGKGSTFEVKFPNGWIEGDVPMKVVPINEKQYANSR